MRVDIAMSLFKGNARDITELGNVGLTNDN